MLLCFLYFTGSAASLSVSAFPRRSRSATTSYEFSNTPHGEALLLPISLSGLIVRMPVDPRNPEAVRHVRPGVRAQARALPLLLSTHTSTTRADRAPRPCCTPLLPLCLAPQPHAWPCFVAMVASFCNSRIPHMRACPALLASVRLRAPARCATHALMHIASASPCLAATTETSSCSSSS